MSLKIEDQNIIALLGIESLPDEEKMAIVEKTATLVQKRLLVRVFDGLDGLRQKEFSELLDKDDQTGLQEFLDRLVPNMPDLLDEETVKVKQEMADWAESLA